MIRGICLSVPAVLSCALLAAGCGGSAMDSSAQKVCNFRSARHYSGQPLTPAETRRLKATVRRDKTIRRIAAGARISIGEVIPWTESVDGLIGADILVNLRPAARFTGVRVPTVIHPNARAPLNTPPLCGHALVSASNVRQLRALVELRRERIASLFPEGNEAKVTREELIGSPPEDPAYRPEPGY